MFIMVYTENPYLGRAFCLGKPGTSGHLIKFRSLHYIKAGLFPSLGNSTISLVPPWGKTGAGPLKLSFLSKKGAWNDAGMLQG